MLDSPAGGDAMFVPHDGQDWGEKPEKPESSHRDFFSLLDLRGVYYRAAQNSLLIPFVLEMIAVGAIVGMQRAMLQ